MSHGWVNPLPSGAVARCGGPALCTDCATEKCRECGRVGLACHRFPAGDAESRIDTLTDRIESVISTQVHEWNEAEWQVDDGDLRALSEKIGGAVGLKIAEMEKRQDAIEVRHALTTGRPLHAIRMEREHQERRWGGAAHDDAHAAVDWLQIVQRLHDEAQAEPYWTGNRVAHVVTATQIAATCVAWLESLDRQLGGMLLVAFATPRADR